MILQVTNVLELFYRNTELAFLIQLSSSASGPSLMPQILHFWSCLKSQNCPLYFCHVKLSSLWNILSLPCCARVCYSVYEICLPPYKNSVSHKETHKYHIGLYCMAFKNNVIGWMWATVQQFCKGSFEMYYKWHSLWVEPNLSRNVHSLSEFLSKQQGRPTSGQGSNSAQGCSHC